MKKHEQTIYYLKQEIKDLQVYPRWNADLIKDMQESVETLEKIIKQNGSNKMTTNERQLTEKEFKIWTEFKEFLNDWNSGDFSFGDTASYLEAFVEDLFGKEE